MTEGIIQIKIRDIRPEGLEINHSIGKEVFEFKEKDSIKIQGNVLVQAKIEKTKTTVSAATHISGTYTSSCTRCLEPIENDWARSCTFYIPINNAIEFIDLGEEIRQEVILSLPPKILCKENCKGICIDCGADLNKEECRCKK